MMTTADKTQRILFMVMPLFFVFIIARFPAGLVLYWVTTNLWTVGQGLITRRLVAKTPAPTPERRSSRTPPKPETAPAIQGDGDGATPRQEKSAASQQPRQVRRKKKRTSRR
jgi:YidC/Oxa1 family membrane protein insertase